jgi:hypothetical protein
MPAGEKVLPAPVQHPLMFCCVSCAISSPVLEVNMSEERPWYWQWWSTRIVAESVVVMVLLTVGLKLAQNAELFTLSDNLDLAVPTVLGITYMLFRAKQSATV